MRRQFQNWLCFIHLRQKKCQWCKKRQSLAILILIQSEKCLKNLPYIIDNNIDLLLISETKQDGSITIVQFQIKGFDVPYRCRRNGKGGGVLLYICKDILSRLLIGKSKCNTETLSNAVNLWKRNWLYKPHQNFISNHFEYMTRLIDKHSNSFDNVIFLGEFSISTNHNLRINFCDLNGFKNFINVPTSHKAFDNTTSIDLIFTNRPG